MIRKQDALDYHSQGRRGKIEIRSGQPGNGSLQPIRSVCIARKDLAVNG